MLGFAIVLGVYEKLSAGSEVAKEMDRLENCSRRWEDNINMYACPDGKVCGILDWSKLAQNLIQQRFLVNTVKSYFQVFHSAHLHILDTFSITPSAYQPRRRNTTKTGHGAFLRTVHPMYPTMHHVEHVSSQHCIIYVSNRRSEPDICTHSLYRRF